MQAGMGVPTTQPDTQSPSPLKQMQRTGIDRGTQVGEDILDAKPGEEEQGTSDDHRETRGSPDRCHNATASPRGGSPWSPSMEDWMWGHLVQDWSSEEKMLVTRSWRLSTLGTYKAPIQRWIDWCRDNGIDPGNPQGRDLGRFLANLFITKKFAYSTILVHKSAVTTFCSGKSILPLSSDFLVRQVLKAISLEKPKETRAEIWDVQRLLDWLSTGTQNLSFFEVSRRTATLLLLVSGRRIQDLTLLKISKNFLTNLGDTIILWPVFGSKTDRGHFRQSGSYQDTLTFGFVQSLGSELFLRDQRRDEQIQD